MSRNLRIADKKPEKIRPDHLPPNIAATYALAIQHHNARRLREAEQCYRQVLASHPMHADSLHWLGVIAHEVGRHDVAVELIGQALTIYPNASDYHCNLANALSKLGKIDEAMVSYRQAITLNPKNPEALTNLGNALLSLHQLEEAATVLEKAVRAKPDLPEAHNNLGNVYSAQTRHKDAVFCYRKAISLRPNYAEAYNNLGAALLDLGRLDETVRCYRKALELNPGLPELHNNLGIVLLKQGLPEQAAECSLVALRLRPEFPEGLDNLGRALAEQGHLDDAAAKFRASITLRPGYAEAHSNLGTVLKEQGQLEAAITCFRTSILHKPDLADAHHNLGITLLTRGDLTEGWQEYEWRWDIPAPADARRNFAQPQWRGEDGSGRTLLIHAEQGFGDTIQFCRYAALARARGFKVILEVQPPLARLLQSLVGADQLVARGDKLPDFDLHCPMLSLPLALGTTLETIPGNAGYLSADATRFAAWQSRLSQSMGAAPRIGLAWAGGSATKSDRQRSLRWEQLASLLDLPGFEFYSLQLSGQEAVSDSRLINYMPEIQDFADTAALVANLDLIISVDTAVAHLAGALGKPVWLLNRFDPDWRWFVGRQDSPWYPTLRQFRQAKPGEWQAVVTEVGRNLVSGGF